MVGFDLSKKMIAEAIERSKNDTRLQYNIADLETIELPKERYDMVHCQFGFHHIADLDRIMGQISNALLPNGLFMFIAEHPMRTSNKRTGEETIELNGQLILPFRDYLEEGRRTVTWLGCQVFKEHHTISSYVNSLIKNGFEILNMVEWAPEDPKLRVIPRHLMIKAKKRTN